MALKKSIESIGTTDHSLLDAAINNTFNVISLNIPQNARMPSRACHKLTIRISLTQISYGGTRRIDG
jgi:hypothetical protein